MRSKERKGPGMVVSAEGNEAGELTSEGCAASVVPEGLRGVSLQAGTHMKEQVQKKAAGRIAERRNEDFIE